MMKTPGSITRKAELIASKNLKRASSKQVVEGDVVKYRKEYKEAVLNAKFNIEDTQPKKTSKPATRFQKKRQI